MDKKDEQIEQKEFNVDMNKIQTMFDTENISSGKSIDILNSMGGLETLMKQLKTDIKTGVDIKNEFETQSRMKELGDNKSKPPPLKSFWFCMCHQTEDFCIRILFCASIFMFFLATVSEDPFESIVQALSILIAIIAVVLIGAMTDYRKEKQFQQLYLEQEQEDKKLFYAIRSESRKQIEHFEKLVGDIVEISPGDNVSVDGIFLKGSSYMEVDESMITGLSETLQKRPLEEGSDQKNCFIRGGSNIFEGQGYFLVCAVGERTFSNRMKQGKEDEEEQGQTPLQKSLELLAKYLVFIGCMCSLFMFIVLELYLIRELQEMQEKVLSQIGLRKILSDFIAAFLIIVLSIPEGLPLIVTLSLAFLIARMKQKNVIIRNLTVSQILGGIDIICFDKTGTLTKNNVVVTNLYADKFAYEGDINISSNSPLFRVMAEGIMVNNTAKLQQKDKSSQSVNNEDNNQDLQNSEWVGNRMDGALMEFVENKLKREIVADYESQIKNLREKIISFSESRNQYCATVVRIKGNRCRIYIKGKTNEILAKCNQMVVKQGDQELKIYEPGDDVEVQQVHVQELGELRGDIDQMSKIYAELSLKSTSFAFKDIETEDKDWEKHIFDEDNYTFISIIGLRDEIRHDAEKCIQSLKDTHVDVKMITGDTRITAVNVSKQLKLIDLDLAQDEIQRQSNILPLYSKMLGSQAKEENNEENKEEYKSDEGQVIQINSSQQIKSEIKEQQIDDEQNRLLAKEQLNKQAEDESPLILNFHEYLLHIKNILKESEKYYTHSVITEQNYGTIIAEILDDKGALNKIVKLNKRIKILADASQEQKSHFVQMLIALNQANLAYVGDGNNDARSLRQAFVGFTPCATATNVAKESSGVLLLKDILDNIRICIRWGRNIYMNIRRFIFFQLSFYFTSIAVMLTASVTLRQQPYSVLEVIWLALVQDIFSAIALSTEVPQKNMLSLTWPAKRQENLITIYILKLVFVQFVYQFIATVFVLFFTPALFGIEPSNLYNINDIGAEFVAEQAVHYTLVFHITALFQIVNLINCRRIGPNEYNVFHGIMKNRPFLYMIVGLIAAEFAIIYLGDRYFKTAPLTLLQNVFCCVIALGSILTFWLSKMFISHTYFHARK